jgi:hypothetical protein
MAVPSASATIYAGQTARPATGRIRFLRHGFPWSWSMRYGVGREKAARAQRRCGGSFGALAGIAVVANRPFQEGALLERFAWTPASLVVRAPAQ